MHSGKTSFFLCLDINTFTMDVILEIKLKPIYIRQSSGTVLMNIPRHKNVVAQLQ